MNSLIRFLTFSTRRPTHVYETTAYMSARLLLGALAFFASYVASPAHVAPFLLLSFAVSYAGASAAQTVRSGAARRQERREREGTGDVSLPCDADLRRAATLGSMLTSCAPMLALGQALASHAVGSLRGWALAAALLSVAQSAFDVAWSLRIYPGWRRKYTRERDRLRAVHATIEAAAKVALPDVRYQVSMNGKDWREAGDPVDVPKDARFVQFRIRTLMLDNSKPNPMIVDRIAGGLADGEQIVVPKRRPLGDVAVRFEETTDDEDAPTCIFSGPLRLVNEMPPGGEIRTTDDGDAWVYVRCESLDDLLSRTDQPASAGTRLYLNDDSPIVEYGGEAEGWFVEWSDGTTAPIEVLYQSEGRERFLAASDRWDGES